MKKKFTLPFGLGNLRFANWFPFGAMIALMAVGICYIYSANAFRDSARLQALYLDQARLCAICIAGGLVLALIDYRDILRWSPLLYIAAVALLAAVPFFGTTRMGATRWIFGIQPSEIAKVATIMAIAHFLGRRDAARDVLDLAFSALLAIIPMVLILMEPDLGTALVFAPVVAAMLFASGTAPRLLLSLVLVCVLAAGIILAAVAAEGNPKTPPTARRLAERATSFMGKYQKTRLLDFLFPDRDPLGRGWNRRQSMIAVGSGGAFGKGFLKGDQNILGYIPQQVSANDFIFSVLAEEKGFAGSSFLLVCYGILLLSVLAAGAAAPEDSGRLLCVGVATLVFCHAFVNVGMSVGMLPITGMPLPFVSYGRTFLAALGLAFGLVQGVAVRSGVQKSKEKQKGNEHRVN